MTYPAYDQLETSEIEYDTGIEVDRTENGAIRGSIGYDQRAVKVTLRHFLSATDLQALRAYELANRGQLDDLVYAGDPSANPLQVMITSLQDQWHASGNYFVTVELEGNET